MKGNAESSKPRHLQNERAIKIMLSIKRLKRSKTDQNQEKSDTKEDKKLCLPMVSSNQTFQAVFCKLKRDQYSGYKKLFTCNKGKHTQIDKNQPEQRRKSVPNEMLINLKNMQKLRKRFSLQSKTHRILTEGSETNRLLSFNSIQKLHQSNLLIDTHKEKINEFEEKLRKANDKKYKESLITPNRQQNHNSLNEIIQQHEKSLSFLRNRNNYHKKQNPSILISGFVEIRHQIFDKTKESNSERMPRFKNKQQSMISKHKAKERSMRINDHSDVMIKRQREGSITGWSSRSFYPKFKPFFIQENSLL